MQCFKIIDNGNKIKKKNGVFSTLHSGEKNFFKKNNLRHISLKIVKELKTDVFKVFFVLRQLDQ